MVRCRTHPSGKSIRLGGQHLHISWSRRLGLGSRYRPVPRGPRIVARKADPHHSPPGTVPEAPRPPPRTLPESRLRACTHEGPGQLGSDTSLCSPWSLAHCRLPCLGKLYTTCAKRARALAHPGPTGNLQTIAPPVSAVSSACLPQKDNTCTHRYSQRRALNGLTGAHSASPK